jgi:hypothetical protein
MADTALALGLSSQVSAEEYNIASMLVEAVQAIKTNVECDLNFAGLDPQMNRSPQVAKAIGMLVGMVAMHEISQEVNDVR